MKTFQNQCAQGDVYFRRVAEVPAGLKRVEPEGDELIVAHSETGHHHVMNRLQAQMFGTQDPNVCYLVIDGEYADLLHKRSFDTHETIRFPKGCYEMRHQQEFTPEGWRTVAD